MWNPLKCACGEKIYLPQRYILATFCLVGVVVGYGQRVSLSIAITEMSQKNISASTSCPRKNTSTKTKFNMTGGKLDWTNDQQNTILGNFYVGYLLLHVPVGIICDKIGARYVLFAGILSSTILTAIQPQISINTPWWVMVIMRNMLGGAQSTIYPGISALYAHWVPPSERGLLGSFSFAANALGTIFGTFLTGSVITATTNWHFGFYTWGLLGAAWCLLYLLYVYSYPNTHPFITENERTLLDESIIKSTKHLKIPWKGILKDAAIWGLISGELGHDFLIYTLMNNLPKYLSDVLHYDLAENSIASSLPYASQWLGGLMFGRLTDYLIKKKGVSVVLMRRTMSFIGIVGPGFFLAGVGHAGCNDILVLILITLSLFVKGAFYSGLKVNHLDMTVNFAGIVMALINGTGALAGFVSSQVINAIAPTNDLHEWIVVWWVVLLATMILYSIYFIFCTGDRRVWDVAEEEMGDFLKAEAERKAAKERKKEEKRARKEAARQAAEA